MKLFKKKENKSNTSIDTFENLNIIEKDNNKETKKEVSKLSIKYQFKNKKQRIRFITRVSMFSALSFVFYAFLKFPLPFFPAFLEINFSNLFIIIGSLLTGPIGGLIICLIRFLIKLPMSSTMYVGELTDLILSIFVMLPASLAYLYKHDKKGGFLGIILSFISWIITSMLLNIFISVPCYIKLFFNNSVDTFINVLSSTIKNIDSSNYLYKYIFLAVLPFNLINGLINCGLALLVYKKISTILKRMGL